jgi:hypothetical protein
MRFKRWRVLSCGSSVFSCGSTHFMRFSVSLKARPRIFSMRFKANLLSPAKFVLGLETEANIATLAAVRSRDMKTF